jgi:hypothetical protein
VFVKVNCDIEMPEVIEWDKDDKSKDKDRFCY